MLKQLVADGRYDYIETGSLLSIKTNVKDILIPSEEDSICMYPLNFEEFLFALGEEQMVSMMKDRFIAMKPMGEAIHRAIMRRFREYLMVGGMPQAVLEYASTRDFEKTDDAKKKILKLYKNARFRSYEDAFVWLEESMVANNSYNVTEPNIGLKLSADYSRLKMYMADTGLLITHTFSDKNYMDNDLYYSILNKKLGINEGMIMENVVAQMLRSAGHKLFFYSRPRTDKSPALEIDFLVSKDSKICPIEVKSSGYTSHKSLDRFREKFSKSLGQSYIIYTKDLQKKDDILCIPIYLTPYIGIL